MYKQHIIACYKEKQRQQNTNAIIIGYTKKIFMEGLLFWRNNTDYQ